ncbi:unnamed protein product [Adineta ricciae]|uniref:Uncharacterized protein n=1 Tax=Adineta ricciae TaxID=249248 RepID=A0A814UPH9_ADIRI|nr:unnamed protein product [Adineta ricciae]CAF1655137.1 unnamed protein product [Adineta ricciae]
MGSESLSHRFAAKDPTFHGKLNEDEKSSSHGSMSHTSGTQPVSVSNGSESSSSIVKHNHKPNSKYRRLIKLFRQQLSHTETTVNAIESLSKSSGDRKNQMLLSTREQIHKLYQRLENLRNDLSIRDHEHVDSIKHDIEHLIDDLKSYKMNFDNEDSINTIDYLVGFPVNISDNDTDDDETLVYF